MPYRSPSPPPTDGPRRGVSDAFIYAALGWSAVSVALGLWLVLG